MIPQRFWDKVEVTDTCWLWKGYTLADGYGQVAYGGKVVRVHRLTWAALHGWPDGALDHLCRVRNCVNPTHLELVDIRTNVLRSEGITAQQYRQTHCKRGHPFDEANTYRAPGRPTHRLCRACMQMYHRQETIRRRSR